MKKTLYTLSGLFLLLTIVSCNKKTDKQTMLSGSTTILVDESVFPIVEDQVILFENTYQANLNISAHPESKLVNTLLKDSIKLAVMTRLLTPEEENIFTSKNIQPKITRFAIDAVALITNKTYQDSVIDLNQVYAYLKNEPTSIKGLVFDNPNSSATRLLLDKAGIKASSNPAIYSTANSEELIKYIAENEDYVGVIGMNWLTQTPNELMTYTENIKVLRVGNVKINDSEPIYYSPSQANIGKKLYPLTRELFMLNYQGTSGLGMGFASFIASDIGQKIILTSGLAPIKLEPLQINITK